VDLAEPSRVLVAQGYPVSEKPRRVDTRSAGPKGSRVADVRWPVRAASDSTKHLGGLQGHLHDMSVGEGTGAEDGAGIAAEDVHA